MNVRLKLVPVVEQPLDRNQVAELLLDTASRLVASGWRINVAFEDGRDDARFTLSGEREP